MDTKKDAGRHLFLYVIGSYFQMLSQSLTVCSLPSCVSVLSSLNVKLAAIILSVVMVVAVVVGL